MPSLRRNTRRSSGPLRTLGVLLAVVVLAACGQDASDEARRVPKPPLTTTTTAAPAVEVVPVTQPAAAPAARAPRPARVSVLPGVVDKAVPAPRAAPARRGPMPLGRIEIPRIGLNHEVFEGHGLDVLKYGPGHWTGTAMPGEKSNAVFPGHRTTHTRPFWDIDKIQKGDLVVFAMNNGRFTYQVTDTFIVNERDTWIANSTDGPTFTIFACHPKGSARQRYVVKGSMIRSEPRPGSAGGGGGASGGGSGSGGGSTPTTQPPSPTTTTTTPCVICLPS